MKPILRDFPMPIFTPRLQIRPRQIGEGKILNAAINGSLAHLGAWLPFAKTSPTVDESEEHCRQALAAFILRENFTLSIYTRDGSTYVGSTGLHRVNWKVPSFEIGYWICKPFEGKGYMTEAVNAMTRYAFEVGGAKRVEIRCDANNERSLAVMTRLGFAREGFFHADDVGMDDKPRDTIITARANADGLPPLEVSWGSRI